MKRHDLVWIFKLFTVKVKSPLQFMNTNWGLITLKRRKTENHVKLWKIPKMYCPTNIHSHINLYDITLKMFLFPCMKAPSSREAFTQISFPSNWWETLFLLLRLPLDRLPYIPLSPLEQGSTGTVRSASGVTAHAPRGESATLQCLGLKAVCCFLIK